MGNRFQRGEQRLFHIRQILHTRAHTHSIFANFLLDEMRPLFCSVRKLEFSSRVAAKLQTNDCGWGRIGEGKGRWKWQ